MLKCALELTARSNYILETPHDPALFIGGECGRPHDVQKEDMRESRHS